MFLEALKSRFQFSIETIELKVLLLVSKPDNIEKINSCLHGAIQKGPSFILF